MTSKAEIIAQKLNELRQSFRNQLPVRIQDIEDAITSLSLNSDNSDALDLLHRNAHSLSGSGGTFGYAQLSAKTSALEEFLLTLIEKKTLNAQDLEEVKRFFSDIKSLSEQEPDEKNKTVSRTSRPSLSGVFAQPQQDDIEQELIYIVDDDLELAEDLALRLEQFSYKVVCFTDAASAENAAREKVPFAMLVDVMLSEGPLSGPELVQDIKYFEILDSGYLYIRTKGLAVQADLSSRWWVCVFA